VDALLAPGPPETLDCQGFPATSARYDRPVVHTGGTHDVDNGASLEASEDRGNVAAILASKVSVLLTIHPVKRVVGTGMTAVARLATDAPNRS